MIKVIYNKVCGRCVQSEPLTSGMVGQTIHFEYSHDFDGLAVTAVFTDGANTANVVNPGNECVIPHEVLTNVGAAVKVGIYAVNGEELVIPTIYATIGFVLKGADPSGGISEGPTLPVWAQTQAMIGNLNALETQAKDNLVLAINEVKQTADSKQDTISDLEAIRTGAAKGATALQSVPNSYRTAAAQDVIDNGLSDRVSAIEGKEADWNGKYSKPTDGIPKTDLESAVQTSLDKAETALQSVPSTYRTASEQDTIDSGKVDKVTGKGLSSNDYTDAAKAKVDTLAPVATSGNYNDLSNKPTIPAPVTEQTVSGWGFTKNTGTYSKPTGGIPKADLANDVQASLGKAETALQEHQSLSAYRTAAEQNIIDNTKQDKLIAGENITIAADGKTISATGGGSSYDDTELRQRIGDIEAKESTWDAKSNFSGSYNDLTDKPTIPDSVTEGTVSGWGFTKNTGTYSKPTGGIPKADLASDVQASLGKAETALQEHQSLAAYRTAEAQNIIDNSKQPKLIAGENITIAADGKTISAKGGSSVPKPLTYDYMPEGYPSKSVQTTTLMEEQEVAFVLNGDSGLYMAQLTNAFEIVAGQTYTVKWDGTEYECVGSFITVIDDLGLGNLSILGVGDDTGEPFLYANGGFGTFDTSPSHTISVTTTGEVATPMAEEFLPPIVAEIKATAEAAQATADNAKFTLDGKANKYSPDFTGDFSHNRKADTVIGANSFAEGVDTTASGSGSHAEGGFTTASAYYAHAEGRSTIASGEYSHAEGRITIASGDWSHAEGDETVASGRWSHAEGRGTIASGEISHVEGKYNIEDTAHKYAHIAGNGTDIKRSNAYTLDWDGNGWFAGNVEARSIILSSPTGKKFKITVDDSGVPSLINTEDSSEVWTPSDIPTKTSELEKTQDI